MKRAGATPKEKGVNGATAEELRKLTHFLGRYGLETERLITLRIVFQNPPAKKK